MGAVRGRHRGGDMRSHHREQAALGQDILQYRCFRPVRPITANTPFPIAILSLVCYNEPNAQTPTHVVDQPSPFVRHMGTYPMTQTPFVSVSQT